MADGLLYAGGYNCLPAGRDWPEPIVTELDAFTFESSRSEIKLGEDDVETQTDVED